VLKSKPVSLCPRPQRTAVRTRSRPARSTSSTSASETWGGRYGKRSSSELGPRNGKPQSDTSGCESVSENPEKCLDWNQSTRYSNPSVDALTEVSLNFVLRPSGWLDNCSLRAIRSGVFFCIYSSIRAALTQKKEIQFSLFCTAHSHKLQICLRGIYNLYT